MRTILRAILGNLVFALPFASAEKLANAHRKVDFSNRDCNHTGTLCP
jgi:hypothetical protein